MRYYWGHAAALLLGITLTVGFYEGRGLVRNTAKALSAASSISAANHRRARDRDPGDEDGAVAAEADRGERGDRKRRKRGAGGGVVAAGEGGYDGRVDKLRSLRSAQRTRLSHGGSLSGPGPVALPGIPGEPGEQPLPDELGPEDELLDAPDVDPAADPNE
ncbi:MAG: hypothetical protein ABMB14_07675 [Myxococcota bacterium]